MACFRSLKVLFNSVSFILFLFVSSVKSVSRPMASTTTKILTKKISLSHGTTKGGGGGPDPFVVKDYKKGLFLLMPSLIIHVEDGIKCFEYAKKNSLLLIFDL